MIYAKHRESNVTFYWFNGIISFSIRRISLSEIESLKVRNSVFNWFISYAGEPLVVSAFVLSIMFHINLFNTYGNVYCSLVLIRANFHKYFLLLQNIIYWIYICCNHIKQCALCSHKPYAIYDKKHFSCLDNKKLFFYTSNYKKKCIFWNFCLT